MAENVQTGSSRFKAAFQISVRQGDKMVWVYSSDFADRIIHADNMEQAQARLMGDDTIRNKIASGEMRCALVESKASFQ